MGLKKDYSPADPASTPPSEQGEPTTPEEIAEHLTPALAKALAYCVAGPDHRGGRRPMWSHLSTLQGFGLIRGTTEPTEKGRAVAAILEAADNA